MAAMPSPDILSMIRNSSSASPFALKPGTPSSGGGSNAMQSFLAGMGFSEFAANIKKLSDIAGGGKAAGNAMQGQTGKPVTPVGSAPRPGAPAAPGAAPQQSLPFTLSKILPLLTQGGGAAAPAAAAAAPAAAMSAPSLMSILGLA